METKRILLADDDPQDIELSLLALEEYQLNNKVDITIDGAETLDYLYQRGEYANRPGGNPIIIFLDLNMPKVSGLEVLEKVKSDPNLKMIPIVVMTSSREDQDIIRSYAHGVNAYVVKPIAFTKFIDVVKQLGLFWVLTNEPPIYP